MTNHTWKERMELAQRRCSEIIDLDQTPPVKYTAVYCNAALAELDDLDKLHQLAIDEARKEERERITHKLEMLMDEKHAEMLGDNLELLYGERECKICGTNPEKQRELIIKTIKENV